MNKYGQMAILVVLGALLIFLIPQHQVQAPSTMITNFETCEEAGGTITISEQGRVCTPPSGECCFVDEEPVAEVKVSSPEFGGLVKSPLKVTGQARGTWFFEANLPVVLKDSNGKILAQQGFQAAADWMTTEFVPFEGVLTFATPETELGVLIINKDNPSGLTEFDSSFAVPVRFR